VIDDAFMMERVLAEQSEALGALAKRSMDLQVTIQEGSIWVGDGEHSVEIGLRCLYGEGTV
jgi:uncharacterized protein YaeQ